MHSNIHRGRTTGLGVKVVSFVNQKGGPGKSTLGASVAVCASEGGCRVIMLDMDPQKTWVHWAEKRGARAPQVRRIDVDQIATVIGQLKTSYDLVFIDTPGENSPRNNTVMRFSDLCIVPCRPTDPDIDATRETVEALERLKKPFVFALTQCLPHEMRASESRDVLQAFGMVAGAPIVSRVDHQDAIGGGYGVTEFNDRGAAAAEIRLFWHSIKMRLQLD